MSALRLYAVVGLVTLGSGTLAAQTTRAAGGDAAELDSATAAAVLHELTRASARGLPTAPIIAKAREGRLKRAPGARIRAAVTALATRLDSSRAALGGTATADEVIAGAEALAAGARPEALRTVSSAATVRPITAPLGALAQLVASGVPSSKAVSMIVELLRRRVAPAQLLAFGNAVESDVAGGLPAEESAAFRLRAASATQSSATAADAVSAPPAVSGARPGTSGPPRRRP